MQSPIQRDREDDSQRHRGISSGVLLTVVAWFVSRLVVGAAWGAARDPFAFDSRLWTHKDSHNYLRIAVQGRTFGRCGTPGFGEDVITRYYHLHWCGLAQWLPAYPYMIRAVNTTGISRPSAGS